MLRLSRGLGLPYDTETKGYLTGRKVEFWLIEKENLPCLDEVPLTPEEC
jgi:hypothetical protein